MLFSKSGSGDAYYSTIKNKLTSADYQELTDPEAQRSLAIEENELIRLLFQAFITLHGQAQAQERQAEEVTQRAASDFTSFYGQTALELGKPTGKGADLFN